VVSCLTTPPTPTTALFPYTTLFRSVYSHEGNGVRMGKTDNLFTIAADHVEMVTAQILEVVVAVHTRNEPIVTMAESLVRHDFYRSEEHTSELQSRENLVCRLLLEKK